MDGTIGEIKMFGGTFAPRNWAFCSGQLLPILNNSALFSILGTKYGGDGRTTFALPDLREKDKNGSPRNWINEPVYIICLNGIYPSRS